LYDANGEKEPPCEQCCIALDEVNVEIWNIYLLVRGQVHVAPMGEIIDLDHRAVLGDIELYVPADKVKEVFELIRECFQIEREFI